jgi:choline kinase
MNISKCSWVIIQAGGRGSRLKHYTDNQPKCLLSINGKTLLQRLMENFPNSSFIVIGDYLFEQLKNYLDKVDHRNPIILIKAIGHGTCGGIKDAITYIPDNTPFILIWCDLLFQESEFPQFEGENLIGLSRTFECRWTLDTGKMKEVSSSEKGIMGFFVFKDKIQISFIPQAGEFVRWLSTQNLDFHTFFIDNVYELGDITRLNNYLELNSNIIY